MTGFGAVSGLIESDRLLLAIGLLRFLDRQVITFGELRFQLPGKRSSDAGIALFLASDEAAFCTTAQLMVYGGHPCRTIPRAVVNTNGVCREKAF